MGLNLQVLVEMDDAQVSQTKKPQKTAPFKLKLSSSVSGNGLEMKLLH
jgi:hypothetical protein